jgi:methyl-accepting chemotaxis protein
MGLGFGCILVITGVLGVLSWRQVTQEAANLACNSANQTFAEAMSNCGSLRRDFGIRGFSAVSGSSKNVPDAWREAYTELKASVAALLALPALDSGELATVRAASERLASYPTLLESTVAAKKQVEDAFLSWRAVGNKFTEAIGDGQKIIDPALAAAAQKKSADDLIKWSQIASSLRQDVIERFLLLRVAANYLTKTQAEEQWVGYTQSVKAFEEGIGAWKQTCQGEPGLLSAADRIIAQLKEYKAAGDSFHAGVATQRQADAEMAQVGVDVLKHSNELKATMKARMDAQAIRTKYLALSVSLGAIALGTLISVLITRSITGPLTRTIAGLTEGAEQVSAAAGQVSAASQSLAEGASEQASSLEETSSALEQMAAMTRTNAGNAKQANELAGAARKAADDGDKTMVQLNEAMSAINGSSEKISKIIKVIEEIAFQTNLLALNAAVEAARAGEHGKGFAVVADEVRNLAMRAAQAAKETTALIEDSVNRARGGTQVASEVGKSLSMIVSDVSKVSELINGISQASDEQAQGVEQVNTAVGQMDKVTQQNAAGAEESASAAEELSAQAETVKGMVNELVDLVEGSGGRGRRDARQQAAGSRSAAAGRKPDSAKKPARKAQPVVAGAGEDLLSQDAKGIQDF